MMKRNKRVKKTDISIQDLVDTLENNIENYFYATELENYIAYNNISIDENVLNEIVAICKRECLNMIKDAQK